MTNDKKTKRVKKKIKNKKKTESTLFYLLYSPDLLNFGTLELWSNGGRFQRLRNSIRTTYM